MFRDYAGMLTAMIPSQEDHLVVGMLPPTSMSVVKKSKRRKHKVVNSGKAFFFSVYYCKLPSVLDVWTVSQNLRRLKHTHAHTHAQEPVSLTALVLFVSILAISVSSNCLLKV